MQLFQCFGKVFIKHLVSEHKYPGKDDNTLKTPSSLLITLGDIDTHIRTTLPAAILSILTTKVLPLKVFPYMYVCMIHNY